MTFTYDCPGHERLSVTRGIKDPEIVPACSVCLRPMRRVYEFPALRINWKRGR